MNFTSTGQISRLDSYRVAWSAFHEAGERGVNNASEVQRTGSEREITREFHIYLDNDDSHLEAIARSGGTFGSRSRHLGPAACDYSNQRHTRPFSSRRFAVKSRASPTNLGISAGANGVRPTKKPTRVNVARSNNVKRAESRCPQHPFGVSWWLHAV